MYTKTNIKYQKGGCQYPLKKKIITKRIHEKRTQKSQSGLTCKQKIRYLTRF